MTMEDVGTGYCNESLGLKWWALIKLCNLIGNVLSPIPMCEMMTMEEVEDLGNGFR